MSKEEYFAMIEKSSKSKKTRIDIEEIEKMLLE